MTIRTALGFLSLPLILTGCSSDPDPGACDLVLEHELGSPIGHPEPLGAGPGEARAGRVDAADLPATASGLAVWSSGDFILANDRVAMVIEDAGPSDLYDPWGGRPVGIARVEGGALVEPSDFGEILILTGRYTVVTSSVTVLSDGAAGGPAIVRAVGTPAPLPFFENIVGALFREEYEDVPTAIDYVLEPGAEHVDIYVSYLSDRPHPSEQPITMHAFMFTPRMPAWTPEHGFSIPGAQLPLLAFTQDGATGFAYTLPDGERLGAGVSVSGFMSRFGPGFELGACAETRRHHARVILGGPGLDGLVAAVARTDGTAVRTVTGTVHDAEGAPAAGVRVHAERAEGGYLSRATTAADGSYALTVPAGVELALVAYRRGDRVVGPVTVGAADQGPALTLAPAGAVSVVTRDAEGGEPLPARVQVLPAGESGIPSVPGHFGEPTPTSGRIHVAFPLDGQATLPLPAGDWEVVVSRGYEYEIHREVVTITGGETAEVDAVLTRVVDTTDVMCGDFHIHTHMSNDSGQDARAAIASAVADGVELPVRTEHEIVASFQPLIEELGLEDWAYGVGSIEMTSMEIWGHMNVVPLEPDPTRINHGAPLWQRYPSAADPAAPVETLEPPQVFDAIRARPERPTIIINHPRGGNNYFEYAGYNRQTGMADFPEAWDEEFTVVEIFNDSGWLANLNGTVADWLSMLDHGRRVFAVGSSDSHGVRSSPIGYPRTCLELGTDDPRALSPGMVRDALAEGRSTISGGIYVDAWVGAVGPGGEATGLGATATVRVRVQAASWVDLDFIDVVVDGRIVDTIAVLPGDADPVEPTIRFDQDLEIDVSATGGYVIIAAYGDSRLEPVHPGRLPFGVTNPIFLSP